MVHGAEEEWFTVSMGILEPVNKVTIQNAGISPSVDEFAEAFVGRSIYSIGDLYSGYDQFQLAIESLQGAPRKSGKRIRLEVEGCSSR